jgi:hypothetical protein
MYLERRFTGATSEMGLQTHTGVSTYHRVPWKKINLTGFLFLGMFRLVLQMIKIGHDMFVRLMSLYPF